MTTCLIYGLLFQSDSTIKPEISLFINNKTAIIIMLSEVTCSRHDVAVDLLTSVK
jgi:hypothetical protein